jgi:hypothetical protein
MLGLHFIHATWRVTAISCGHWVILSRKGEGEGENKREGEGGSEVRWCAYRELQFEQLLRTVVKRISVRRPIGDYLEIEGLPKTCSEEEEEEEGRNRYEAVIITQTLPF